MKCGDCGKAVQWSGPSTRCSACGAPPMRFCFGCGDPTFLDSNACATCGKKARKRSHWIPTLQTDAAWFICCPYCIEPILGEDQVRFDPILRAPTTEVIAVDGHTTCPYCKEPFGRDPLVAFAVEDWDYLTDPWEENTLECRHCGERVWKFAKRCFGCGEKPRTPPLVAHPNTAPLDPVSSNVDNPSASRTANEPGAVEVIGVWVDMSKIGTFARDSLRAQIWQIRNSVWAEEALKTECEKFRKNEPNLVFYWVTEPALDDLDAPYSGRASTPVSQAEEVTRWKLSLKNEDANRSVEWTLSGPRAAPLPHLASLSSAEAKGFRIEVRLIVPRTLLRDETLGGLLRRLDVSYSSIVGRALDAYRTRFGDVSTLPAGVSSTDASWIPFSFTPPTLLEIDHLAQKFSCSRSKIVATALFWTIQEGV